MANKIKATGIIFKIYSLYIGNYLYNFLFAFQVSKISNLKKKSGFTDFLGIVYQLYQSLIFNCGYIIFMKKFFIYVKLLKILKDIGICIYGTTKASLKFLIKLLQIQKLSTKKKNREMCRSTITIPNLLYFVKKGLRTTQIIRTVYLATYLKKSKLIPQEKRQEISNNSILQSTNKNIALSILFLICESNKYIRRSNINS